MPNYCHNNIKIKGTVKNMKKFYDAITETYHSKKYQWLTFAKTVPLNSCMDPTEYWGTKWDINPPKSVADCTYNAWNEYEIIVQSDTNYEILCNTAWAPPTDWAKQCSRNYNISIRIASVESGCNFYGLFKVRCSKSPKNLYDIHLDIKDYSSTIKDGDIDWENDSDDEESENKDDIDERKSYLHRKDNISLLKKCKGIFRDHMEKYNLTSFGG